MGAFLAQVGPWLLGAGAIVTAIASLLRSRGQNQRDAADAWAQLLGPLQERLAVVEAQLKVVTEERDSLREMVRSRDHDIAKLQAKVELLTTQIIALGHKPFDASG